MRLRDSESRNSRNESIGVVDAGFGLGGAGLGAAAEPFHLDLHAIAQALLGALLPFHVGVSLVKESGITAFHAQQARRVDPVELDNFRCDVLQKIAIVSDHDEGEFRGAEQPFKPCDAFQVEMIRRLIEEQNVGLGDESFSNSQAFEPAAAEAGGLSAHAGGAGSVVFRKAGAAQSLAKPLFACLGRYGAAFERGFNGLA